MFGIKDKIGKQNRYLVFRGFTEPESKLVETQKPQVPFLDKELAINSDYDVELVMNYIDSSSNPICKYEIQVAINKETRDTILFQEINYVIQGNNLVTSLIIYDNRDTREEMRLVCDDAVRAIMEAVKDVKR